MCHVKFLRVKTLSTRGARYGGGYQNTRVGGLFGVSTIVLFMLVIFSTYKEGRDIDKGVASFPPCNRQIIATVNSSVTTNCKLSSRRSGCLALFSSGVKTMLGGSTIDNCSDNRILGDLSSRGATTSVGGTSTVIMSMKKGSFFRHGSVVVSTLGGTLLRNRNFFPRRIAGVCSRCRGGLSHVVSRVGGVGPSTCVVIRAICGPFLGRALGFSCVGIKGATGECIAELGSSVGGIYGAGGEIFIFSITPRVGRSTRGFCNASRGLSVRPAGRKRTALTEIFARGFGKLLGS